MQDNLREKFNLYLSMLLEQNEHMNLTGITDPAEVSVRHFEDSLHLLNVVPVAGGRMLDVGAGAGFPGIPIKLAEPALRLTLLDATAKKIEFLKFVCEHLGLPDVECLHARAEEQAHIPGYRDGFDLVVARGVANLHQLCELCMPFVRIGGFFLAMKETDCTQEVSRAQRAIQVLGGQLERVHRYTLSNDVEHAVVIIRKSDLTPKGYPRRWSRIKDKPL